jgi:hypothetical protein
VWYQFTPRLAAKFTAAIPARLKMVTSVSLGRRW